MSLIRLLSVTWLVALLAPSVLACLWDRDTLAIEMRGLPHVSDAILGRFETYPPLYYEMRLKRVAEELRSDPDRLDLYDDAAVACDRLGQIDEAIAWMAKKRAALDRTRSDSAAWREQEYRYLANLGTFYLHRWFVSPVATRGTADLEKSGELVSRAIELNPDAHFGREVYQLRFIRWAEESVRNPGQKVRLFTPTDPDWDPAEDVRGVTGLIVQGLAWGSPDIMRWLAELLSWSKNASMAALAHQREMELIRSGVPRIGQPDDTPYAKWMPYEEEADYVRREYPAQRQAAEAWRAARAEFMEAKLRAGRHPDTDPEFWKGIPNPPAPPLSPAPRRPGFATGIALLVGPPLLGLALAGLAVYFIVRAARKRRLSP